MSSGFVYNLRSNCPVCGGSHKSCRSAGDLIFCRSHLPAPKEYHYVKDDPHGFGVYAPGDGSNTDELAEARERRRQESEHRERVERERLAQTSTRLERHAAIRKLARIHGLSGRHLQELKRRGLTKKEIERGLFFTIPDCKPWERPELPTIPFNIPGVIFIRGRKYLGGKSGIACPVWQNCQSVGWQVLADDKEDGKYRWAKGEYSSHLKNGELPMVAITSANREVIWLTEGVLKPYIAATRHSINVISMPNANYAGVPEQFKQATDGVKLFIIALDGGDLDNPDVFARWQSQIKFIRSVFPTAQIKIAWWNQTTKKQPDIDEIQTLEGISYLPPKVVGLEGSMAAAAVATPTKQQWVKEKKESDRANWLAGKAYKPHLISDSQWCDFAVPGHNTLTVVKAGLSAGKTTRLCWIVEQLRASGEPLRFINLGYRNSLLHQFNKAAGFHHIQDGSEGRLLLNSNEGYGISLCLDSLLRLKSSDFGGATVIIDEFTSVIRHLLTSKTIISGNRRRVIDHFADCLKQADRVIVLDALASNFWAEYLHQLCPLKTLIRWENTYQRPRPQVLLMEGAINAMGDIRKRDKSPLYAQIAMEVAQGASIAIACDSQNRAEALDKLLSKTFPDLRGVRIDSKTVAEKGDAEEFLNDASAYLAANTINWVIYTSSAESGIDININNYFRSFYGLFDGVLSVDAIVQMIGRVRDPGVPRYIYCSPKLLPGNLIGEFPESAEKLLQDKIREIMHGINTTTAFSGDEALGIPEMIQLSVKQIVKTPSDKMLWAMNSLRSYEGHNLRQCVKEVLESQGFPVTIVADRADDGMNERVKESSEEIRFQEAIDIHRAEQVQELPDKSWNLTWDDRAVEINYFLRKRLPGIEHRWTPELIKFLRSDEPEFIRQQERWLRLKHPHLSSRLARQKIAQFAQYTPGVLADWKDDTMMIDTLRECGLLNLIESDQELSNDSAEVKQFIKKVSAKRKAVGKSKGNDSPMKFVNRLARMFGLKFSQSRREGNQRYYRPHGITMNDRRRLLVLECLRTKWESILSGEVEKIDYSSILVPNLEWISADAATDEIAVALTYCESGSEVGLVLDEIKANISKLHSSISNAAKLFRFNLPDEYEPKTWLKAIANYLQPIVTSTFDYYHDNTNSAFGYA